MGGDTLYHSSTNWSKKTPAQKDAYTQHGLMHRTASGFKTLAQDPIKTGSLKKATSMPSLWMINYPPPSQHFPPTPCHAPNQKHRQNSLDEIRSSILQVTPAPKISDIASVHIYTVRAVWQLLEHFLVYTDPGSFWKNSRLPVVSLAMVLPKLLGNLVWESTFQGVFFPRSTSHNKRNADTKLNNYYNQIMVNDSSLVSQGEITLTP